jgi:PAS domain S-box-containing protein
MNKLIRLLILEDSPDDAQLALLQLEQDGFRVEMQRVETEAAFCAALESRPDLILADYSLPSFSGIAALELRNEHCPDTPFILVSGSIGEELAVTAMKNGADDYLLKDRPARLGEAARRALEQARLREAAKKSAQLLETIFDETHVLMAYLDPQMNFVRVNRAYALADEREPAFYPGKNHFDLFPNEENEAIFRRVAETGEPHCAIAKPFEYAEHPERGVSHWDWTLMPIKNEGGQVAGLILTLVNVTERVQTEIALRESETRFRTVADFTYDWEYWIGPEGKLIYMSPSCARITGYEAGEFFADPDLLNRLVHPDDREAWAEHRRELATRMGALALDFRITHRDGEVRWIAHICQQVLDGAGQRLGRRASNRDITGRKQHERELESIAAVSAALRAARARADMLPIILGQALDLLQAGGAALAMRDPASGETVVELARGQWQTWTGRRLAPGAGISGQVIASGQPYLSDDAASDPRAVHPDLFRNLHAAACVPLIVHDHTIGALWVGRERGFAADEVRLLTSIADIAANAIHRAALHELTERRAEQLLSLHEIDVAISSSLDLRLTLRVLVSQITSRLRVDAAAVLMLEPHSQRLQFAAASGFHTPGMEQASLRLGEGYAGRAALERRAVFVPDMRRTGELTMRTLAFGEGFVAYYGVPLIVKGQVMGVLEIYQRTPLTRDGAWLEFMETLATQATIAIDNATLFNNLQRSNLELQLAYDATIEGWSRALDLREHETETHSGRVTEMTLRLAHAAGINEAELVHIRRGALLHDIGKMGVPDSILLKPGKLTEEEWAVMRRHPQQAYDLLAPITFLRPALDIPYCHHEKWDGAGYPRQLKGDTIPLAARLFAVVDVWDALRSNRPYRQSWPEEKVRDYIRASAGTHFDPGAVELFLLMMGQASAPPAATKTQTPDSPPGWR